MARHVDALTAATLKNLREQWWDTEFSTFLQDTLRPRPGNRILDVGCGEGTAELSLGRLRVSQLALFAIDRNLQRVAHTAAEGRSHNYRLQLAGADVTRLPFTDSMTSPSCSPAFSAGDCFQTPVTTTASGGCPRCQCPSGQSAT